MKKVLLSTIALLSLIYTSPVVYGEMISTSESAVTSSTSKEISTNSTTSSSLEDTTNSSSSVESVTPINGSTTNDSTQASVNTDSSSTSVSKANTSSTMTSSSSTNQESTQASVEPTPSLTAKEKEYYDVKSGAKVTKADLLKLVTYTNGDKNNLDIVITSNYAYVSKNGQQNSKVYHTDLDALLGTANLNNIQVMTISQAQKLGLTLAQGNANKNIEVINCSLPGQYGVTFKDRKTGLTAATTVNVGNPASTNVSENTQEPATVTQTTTASSTVATPKTNNATTVKTTPLSASKSTLPKTGEKDNPILTIAGMLTALSACAFVLIKKFK